MSMLFSIALLMAVAPGDASTAPAAPAAEKSQAPALAGRELDQAVHAALRRWANPSKDNVEPAAREFLTLYQDLRKDTTLAWKTRKHLALKLRSRLTSLVKQMEQADADDQQPDTVDAAQVRGVLAQRGGGQGQAPGGGAGQNAAGNGAYNDLVELIQSVIAPTSWERAGGPGVIRGWWR